METSPNPKPVNAAGRCANLRVPKSKSLAATISARGAYALRNISSDVASLGFINRADYVPIAARIKSCTSADFGVSRRGFREASGDSGCVARLRCWGRPATGTSGGGNQKAKGRETYELTPPRRRMFRFHSRDKNNSDSSKGNRVIGSETKPGFRPHLGPQSCPPPSAPRFLHCSRGRGLPPATKSMLFKAEDPTKGQLHGLELALRRPLPWDRHRVYV